MCVIDLEQNQYRRNSFLKKHFIFNKQKLVFNRNSTVSSNHRDARSSFLKEDHRTPQKRLRTLSHGTLVCTWIWSKIQTLGGQEDTRCHAGRVNHEHQSIQISFFFSGTRCRLLNDDIAIHAKEAI